MKLLEKPVSFSQTLLKLFRVILWYLRQSSLCQCITGLTLSRSYQPSSRMSPHMQGMQNKHLQNVSAAKPYLGVGEAFFINLFLVHPSKSTRNSLSNVTWTVPSQLPTWSVECLSLQAFLEPQVIDQPSPPTSHLPHQRWFQLLYLSLQAYQAKCSIYPNP